MKRLTYALLAVPLAALVAGAYVLIAWPDVSEASDNELPEPIAALADRGLDIVGTFDAPSGLTGYAATFQGRPIAIYLTANGQHAILGTLVDGRGKDVTTEPLERIVSEPQGEKVWAQLESASWIRDGSNGADTVIYEFTDPNCPYCHKFWELARPWVEAGKVQIRHVMVGILKPSSAPRAATMLAADKPEAAFARSEQHYGHGGIQVPDEIPTAAREKVVANNQLMRSLGYFATPAILYKKPSSEVGVKQGLPQGDEVQEILGGPKP